MTTASKRGYQSGLSGEDNDYAEYNDMDKNVRQYYDNLVRMDFITSQRQRTVQGRRIKVPDDPHRLWRCKNPTFAAKRSMRVGLPKDESIFDCSPNMSPRLEASNQLTRAVQNRKKRFDTAKMWQSTELTRTKNVATVNYSKVVDHGKCLLILFCQKKGLSRMCLRI